MVLRHFSSAREIAMSPAKYSDPWERHKDDLTVWRRFLALWELRRKWRWAHWFYERLERYEGHIIEPAAWTLAGGERYMHLCLWIALLRSVHEGITKGLDAFDTPESEKVAVAEVLPPVPPSIQTFPSIKEAKDFRNVVFHCQWVPRHKKLDMDEAATKQLEKLHMDIGDWLINEFRATYVVFKTKYDAPDNWAFIDDGTEFMPELNY
jgi:hypothetical protein